MKFFSESKNDTINSISKKINASEDLIVLQAICDIGIMASTICKKQDIGTQIKDDSKFSIDIESSIEFSSVNSLLQFTNKVKKILQTLEKTKWSEEKENFLNTIIVIGIIADDKLNALRSCEKNEIKKYIPQPLGSKYYC
ncbi:hypothetical protein ACFL23_00445 [Patescibacteria group bacterium]